MRAPECRALPQHDLPDRRTAYVAGFASAAVDVEFAEEIAGRAIGVDEVAQRRAAAFDRPGEDALHFRSESRVAGARNVAGGAAGIDELDRMVREVEP